MDTTHVQVWIQVPQHWKGLTSIGSCCRSECYNVYNTKRHALGSWPSPSVHTSCTVGGRIPTPTVEGVHPELTPSIASRASTADSVQKQCSLRSGSRLLQQLPLNNNCNKQMNATTPFLPPRARRARPSVYGACFMSDNHTPSSWSSNQV